jgi:folate-binding protein YgfZ
VITADDVKLVCEPGASATELSSFLNRFIFPFDKVSVADASDSLSVSLVVGANAVGSKNWPGTDCLVLPDNDLTAASPEAQEDLITSRLLEGFTVLHSAELPPLPDTETLTGDDAMHKWEALRRETGRFSLATDARPYNATALELGLMHTLHFRKGCFVGNEVVSKQVATKAVRRHLTGLRAVGETLLPGDEIEFEGEGVVGVVSSGSLLPGGLGLGLVKSKLLQSRREDVGKLQLFVRRGDGRISVAPVRLPYPRFDAAKSSRAPPVDKLPTQGKTILLATPSPAASTDGSPESAEEERKRKKLEEMAAKVAQLQAAKKRGAQ